MGNQLENFNPSFKLWSLYRSSLYSKGYSSPLQPSEQPFLIHDLPNEATPFDQLLNDNLIQKKFISALNKQENRHLFQTNLDPINAQVIRSRIPSIITGYNMPPASQQLQNNKKAHHKYKQTIKASHIHHYKEKPTYQNIGTILVKNRVRYSSQEKKVKFASKIDLVDSIKTQIKAARLRIDNLANYQQKEYVWILKELESQKRNGFNDRCKALFLIKESIDYEKLIVGLRTKRQYIVRILNDLNEQKVNENMKQVFDEVNQYIDNTEQKFIRMDWRAIILETFRSMDRYIKIVTEASTSPEVLEKYDIIEQEINPRKLNMNQFTENRQQQQRMSINNNNYNETEYDPRQSHQIIIDSIQKMIAGDIWRDDKVRSNQVQKGENNPEAIKNVFVQGIPNQKLNQQRIDKQRIK